MKLQLIQDTNGEGKSTYTILTFNEAGELVGNIKHNSKEAAYNSFDYIKDMEYKKKIIKSEVLREESI